MSHKTPRVKRMRVRSDPYEVSETGPRLKEAKQLMAGPTHGRNAGF
jgi:hypothetical protein